MMKHVNSSVARSIAHIFIRMLRESYNNFGGNRARQVSPRNDCSVVSLNVPSPKSRSNISGCRIHANCDKRIQQRVYWHVMRADVERRSKLVPTLKPLQAQDYLFAIERSCCFSRRFQRTKEDRSNRSTSWNGHIERRGRQGH